MIIVAPWKRQAVSKTLLILALAAGLAQLSTPASAVPSFSVQTDQPCSACHVNSFGPRLKQMGRDFKLYGYVANDTKSHGIPISIFADASFTHTSADMLSNVAAGYAANDNVTFEKLAGYYAGQITSKIGAFVEASYDGVANSAHWEDFDV